MAARLRDESIDVAVMLAGRELLAETGYSGFSVDLLCQRVGITKTTVYARWPTARRLLAAVLADSIRSAADTAPVTSRDSVRADITAAVTAEIRLAASTTGRGVALAVLHAIDSGVEPEELAQVIAERRSALGALIAKGIETGECAADTDVELVTELLFDAVWGAVVSGSALGVADADRLVGAALPTRP